jgi:hypothetical protein
LPQAGLIGASPATARRHGDTEDGPGLVTKAYEFQGKLVARAGPIRY